MTPTRGGRLSHRARDAARRVYLACAAAGIDPLRLARTMRSLPRFASAARAYATAARSTEFPLRPANLLPILSDRDSEAGALDRQYFFQDLWAARKVFEARPESHVDVGSRIDGFVAHVLTFMPVTVLDVRPLSGSVAGLTYIQTDATSLANVATDSVPSLSSLHAVEHFGLGRYGDHIDPHAWRDAMRALQRVLRPDGRLYFSVPIGRQRVMYNAQRVFAPRTVLDAFDRLHLASFAAIDDAGRYVADAQPTDFSRAWNACGLFELTKSPAPSNRRP